MDKSTPAATPWRQQLESYLQEQGLRLTRQRLTIAEAFFEAEGHPDVEKLTAAIRQRDKRIGQATVYRTVKLLVESGLAQMSRFGGETARYEAHGEHHDHLVCTHCDKIIEFRNDTIERLQEWVARLHGFQIEDHRLELYGRCRDCQPSEGAD